MSDWRVYRVTLGGGDGGAVDLRLELSGGAIVDAVAALLEAELRLRLSERRLDRSAGVVFSVPGAAVCFASAVAQKRVVCFLLVGTSDPEQLGAFQGDLAAFVADCRPLLVADILQPNSSLQLAGKLARWHDECIAYLPRCVSALAASGALAKTIQAALLGKPPMAGATTPSPEFAADVAKFAESLRVIPRAESLPVTPKEAGRSALIDLLGDDVSVAASPSFEQKTTEAAGIDDEDDGQVDRMVVEWAEWIAAVAKCEPLAVRGAIERVKAAASKELNATRKLLTQAQTSHHAMWHCIVALQESPARRVVRGLLLADHALSGSSGDGNVQQNNLAAASRLRKLIDAQPPIPHSRSRIY